MRYSRNFFKIQLQFASIISKKRNISYSQALFLYTCIYVRLFGYRDDCPPRENDIQWEELIHNLPRNRGTQLTYLYSQYLNGEAQPKPKSNLKRFGCFSYFFHKKINQYELHFGAHDPKGNLGMNRIQARLADWRNLFKDMQSQGRHNTTCKIDTWLMNIDAFRRLLPSQFVAATKPYRVGTTQTFTFWGPLVNRFGKVQTAMKNELFRKLQTENNIYIEDYFPRQALTSEVKTEIFYEYYLNKKY